MQPIDSENGKVGIAIGLDAFTPEYLRTLDNQGTCIVIQNDANDRPWARPSHTGEWQPQEWLNSVLGCLQDDYPNLHYNICAMQSGNFFDLVFDGQSTITKKSECEPDPRCNFVGNEGFRHTVTGKPMKGEILALSPWVVEDPQWTNPHLSLAERRTVLAQVAQQLSPGGASANQYPESVIWADVDVPVA